MEASKRNLTADAGGLFEFSARWTEDGTPRDLTGWSGSLVVTTREEEPTTLATATAELDDQGNIVAQILPDDLPGRGAHAYSLRLVAPDETAPRFLMVGVFTVRTPGDV